jgi:hypothetical protein
MPVQAWIIVTNRRQSGRRESVALERLERIWLVDPTDAALSTDNVLNGEGEVAVKVGLPASPSEVAARYCVLPRRGQLRKLAGCIPGPSVDPSPRHSVQRGPQWSSSRLAADMRVGLPRQGPKFLWCHAVHDSILASVDGSTYLDPQATPRHRRPASINRSSW